MEQWKGKDANQRMTNKLQIQETWCQDTDECRNVSAPLPFPVNQVIPLGASAAF